MFLFYRLLLAHVIADFPLQIKSIYRFKTESPLGSFLHSGIFSSIAILLVWPYWNLARIWEFMLFLWLVHAIQDWLKVLAGEKYRLDNIWVFLLDQALHVGFLGTLFLFGLARLIPPEALSKLVSLYNDNTVVIYLIAFVSVGFGGGILISYIKQQFYSTGEADLTSLEKYPQVLERLLIMGSMLLEGYYYLVIPGIWIIHGGYAVFKRRSEKRFSVPPLLDLVLNTILAVSIILILKSD